MCLLLMCRENSIRRPMPSFNTKNLINRAINNPAIKQAINGKKLKEFSDCIKLKAFFAMNEKIEQLLKLLNQQQ